MSGLSPVATTAVTIPTARGSSQSFSQRTALDGVEYVLAFDWNDRAGAWFFSLAATDETAILSGKKITVDTDLLGGVTDPARPPGQLVCFEVSGRPDDPGLDDLGASHELCYVTSTGTYLGTWQRGTTYARAALVVWQGDEYFGLVDGNRGHAPDVSPASWAKWENGREVAG